MRVERDPQDLRGLSGHAHPPREEVTAIVEAVRRGGDASLQRYSDAHDGNDGKPIRVTAAELEAALQALEPDLRAGLEVAIANVAAVAEASLSEGAIVTLPQGQSVTIREIPVRRAAIYVPGGRNPYPSSVVMGAVTAAVAGVQDVVVCAPGAHPAILAGCALCGVKEVLRAGGAHVVAALAYGTETIARADVIAGPGGPYVQEAKRQVFGDVGIDMYAGPSDLLVVADGDADPELIAADLLAQAEHGPGTVVALVSDSRELLDAVAPALEALESDAVAALVHSVDPLEIVESFAPEHLQLVGERAEALAPAVTRGGCVLVGPQSGTAFSDYVAGSNHTLPTEGAARFASGLNPGHFRRRVCEVRIGAAAGPLAQAGAPIAEAEGFVLHANSMRKRQNPPS